MKISIIIPVYNQEINIQHCLANLLQQLHSEKLEILVVDDCSTDDTFANVSAMTAYSPRIKLFKTVANGGPGAARNVGLDKSSGEWIMFVDSDDLLSDNAIECLLRHLSRVEADLMQRNQLDIVGFDFKYSKSSSNNSRVSGRRDLASLTKTKHALLNDYIALMMDGSVIYSLFRRNLIMTNNIRFRDGLHEDVDFTFKAYFYAKRISVLPETIYLKNDRLGSIVNTLTVEHIIGFFNAYREMLRFMVERSANSADFTHKYNMGLIGLTATRVLLAVEQNNTERVLYQTLFEQVTSTMQHSDLNGKAWEKPVFESKYIKLYQSFTSLFKQGTTNIVTNVRAVVDDLKPKSWSCYDLQHSIYLAPNQIRTCCKRYFVEDKIKGDVVLLDNSQYPYDSFNIDNVLKEKRKLYVDINKGASDDCDQCPFLEFKTWSDIKIEHISLEYHSVCNMKCSYCSDTYYDGKKCNYSIEGIIGELIARPEDFQCKSIVWGGGEPTLGKDFSILINSLFDAFPSVKQRVISNATVLSDALALGIEQDKAILVTSIDAGDADVFFQVRKYRQFDKVLANLALYATHRPKNITIKYIFLPENTSLQQVTGFVEKIKQYGLQQCNFQISYDFNEFTIDDDSLVYVYILHGLLTQAKASLVFLDDLFMARLKPTNINYQYISDKLATLGYSSLSPSVNKQTNIVIWGAGKQTEYLLKNTHFREQYRVVYIVDDTPSKIGTQFRGFDILSPEELVHNDYPILISASQSTSIIMQRCQTLGLKPTRIVRDLIV